MKPPSRARALAHAGWCAAVAFLTQISSVMSAPVTPEFIQQEVARGRAYTLVLLKAGPNRSRTPEETAALQLAHLKYLFELRVAGSLVLNGPLTSDTPLRGIAIFNTDVAEARRLAEADPAVQAGSLVIEAHPWFGLPGDTLPGAPTPK